MRRLRDPETGCPWDLQQDLHTLVRYTLEEVYEVVDAIEHDNLVQLQEELGDLLFQIVFYTQLCNEQGAFDLQQVIDAISDKLVRRHPHVFPVEGELTGRSLDEITLNWESRKEQERANKGCAGLMGDIPVAMPAIQRAQKIQSRLARVGFDWAEPYAVLAQLRLEIDELEQAMRLGDSAACTDELGDVLFSAVNLARHLDLDPEGSLRSTNSKVTGRISMMETCLAAESETLEGQTMERLESLWQQVKQNH